jgi:hypothetical protein
MSRETGIEIVNAVVESATLHLERGFALVSWLQLNYGGTSQGFGGYVLGGTGDAKTPAAQHGQQPNLCAEWVVSCLRAAGVDNWKDIPGKVVRVRREAGWNGRIVGIGHAIKDDCWFLPEQRIADLQSEYRAALRTAGETL